MLPDTSRSAPTLLTLIDLLEHALQRADYDAADEHLTALCALVGRPPPVTRRQLQRKQQQLLRERQQLRREYHSQPTASPEVREHVYAQMLHVEARLDKINRLLGVPAAANLDDLTIG